MQLGRPVGVHGRPQDLAAEAEGGRARRQGLGQGHSAGHQLGVGHDAVDQAPLQRLRRGDPVAQQRHFHGPRLADHARQQIGRPAVRHQADAPERLQEIGALSGHDQVAEKGERTADAGRRAIHRRDQGNRHLPHVGDQRIIDRLQRRPGVRLAVAVPTAAARTVRQVGAGAEPAALAGQQDRARRVLAVRGVLEGVQQLRGGVGPRRVHRRRIGQGDDGDRAVPGGPDLLIAHCPSRSFGDHVASSTKGRLTQRRSRG